MKLRRIDSELVRRKLARSRTHAQEMIAEGRVKLDGEVVMKPARQMDPAQAIVIAESEQIEYVSRGAHKDVAASTLEPPQADSRMSCCEEAPPRSSPLTSATDNSHGVSNPTPESKSATARMCAQ